MCLIRNVVWGVTMLLVFPVVSQASPCQMQALADQRKDVATIERLEQEWTRAYLGGDTEFERCLLTPDFTEIMRTGEVKVLKDELAFAEANKGKRPKIPDAPKSVVLVHRNVAVAYGTSTSKLNDGAVRTVRYADYYVWENGAWHAFFAQQSEVPAGKT